MNRIIALLTVSLASPAYVAAQDTPFKLGTFEDNGEVFVGLVLDDSLVVNLPAANSAIAGARAEIPADMHGMIAAYDTLRPRLGRIADAAAAAGSAAAWASDLSDVKILPPIRPNILYNSAANYAAHAAEMARLEGAWTEAQVEVPDPMPGVWEREEGDIRQNPYVFLKMASTVIADGEAIRIPPQRPNLDWECELAAVIGTSASRVSPDDAEDYIFGYTLENDVSDRIFRGDGRMGSDWFLMKNHDTFGPLGPFIVPKEFISDPHALEQTLTLSGTVMQESNTGFMTHDTFDMVSYVSHITTMQPGDIVAMGSPAGVGTARETPVYMSDGDVAVCTIEGIGTLTNPVVGP